ncbi:MAG: gliding motility-associated C-terminal domain-containing protein [Bacteroidia bacterium]|nr:gliding motility-associated C-terminal domain-containing protein [Bacteroidia bacterium]
MKKKFLYFILAFLPLQFLHSQTVVLNEVSQGPSGSKEYIELLVTWTPTCVSTLPCVDMRNWYIDDNNGTFAPGAGVGIASGCVRFSNDPMWACIPVGTIILIYNDADLNALVPAQDLSMADGNCKLVIPISNCTLFSVNSSSPNTGTSTYPTTGFAACGSWTPISMANGGDSFQIRDNNGVLIHAVSWGNNSTATIVYMGAGTQAASVCSMLNSVNNNPASSANWGTASAPANETPGAPNNAANAAWISSMNYNCSAITPLAVTNAFTNAGCTCNGSASVTASGAIAPYTYSWAPGGGSAATASGLCAGTYTCTVTSSNGCVLTSSVTIVSASSITTTVTPTNVNCNGALTGSATVAAAGGTGAYTYSWAPSGGSAATASGLSAGNYTATITDAAGCVQTASVAITQPTVLTATIAQTNVLCNSGTTGSATVTPSGGTTAYSYLWSPSGGSAATVSGLAAGNYTATITDAAGCVQTASVAITQPTVLTATTAQTNVLCNGGATGSATVTASGGTTAYTYIWSPSGVTASSATGLAAGNYTCTITDANSCTVTATSAIIQPIALTASITSSAATCGNANGSATVTPAGGTGAYSYLWLPSGGTAATEASLSAGSYSCTITDANSCTVTAIVVVPSSGGVTATITSSTNVLCNGTSTGSATAAGAGGTGPYSFSWSPSGATGATANSLAANTYAVNVTDALGCLASATVSITQPVAINAATSFTPALCNGGNTGTANVIASGGTPGYTYAWLPSGGTAPTANSLSANTYTVTITDANSCTVTVTTTVTEPAALTANTTALPVTCFGGSDGSASVIAVGGTAGYTYSWSPVGGTSSTANSLSSTNYSVTVTDANNCTVTATATVSEAPQLTINVTSTPAACGSANGTANATVAGGTGGYSYLWTPSGGTASAATSLASGTYTVDVSDANGCTATGTTTVGSAGSVSVSVSAVANVSCFGLADGSITISTSGGIAPISINWTPSGGTTTTATNLSAGNYTVNVTDGNGCVTSANALISEPLQLTLNTNSTPVLCYGDSNGSATVIVSGGTAGYAYMWSPSGGSSSSANSLSANSYTVTVTDANNCVATSATTVAQPAALAISAAGFAATCNGLCNGQTVVLPAGGTTPYNCLWSSGSTLLSNTNVCAGTYTATITDANGCVIDTIVTVTEPAAFVVGTNSAASDCNNSNGIAVVTVNGSVSPYTFNWTGFFAVNNDSLMNVFPGSYSVAITDANGCSTNTVVVVANNPGFVLSIASQTNVNCFGGTNGSINSSITGGNAPFSYLWSNGQTTANATGLTSGSYCLIVNDVNACADTICTNITQPTALSVTTTNDTICSGQTSSVQANASGGNGVPYSYSWNAGVYITQTISVSPATTTNYTVIATDPLGCNSSSAVSTVVVLPPLSLVSGNDTICPGTMGNIQANASGGNGNYTYTIMPGAINNATGNFSVTAASTQQYTITVSDACTTIPATSNSTLNIFSLPVINPVSPSYSACPVFCTSVYDSTALSSGQIQNWNWGLSNGSVSSGNTGQFCISQSGSYTLTLVYTSVDGCADTISINDYFTVFPQPTAGFTTNNTDATVLEPGFIFSNTSLNADNYLWNFGDSTSSNLTNPNHDYTSEGTYPVTLIASNQFGCTDTTIYVITINPDFTFYAPNTFTPDGNDLNATFLPLGVGWDNPTFQMWVYDRWGNNVFSTNEFGKGWDGRANGGTELAQQDVYVWKVKLNDVFGKPHSYVGHVTIVR